ncbi:MAG TPA: choice-of-anchor tandem repeat GloVer-containing protein [Ideonella sp.]|nr:choice-of-anchor tandem repeat GloVer-containing protein [Ideonella sp.]
MHGSDPIDLHTPTHPAAGPATASRRQCLAMLGSLACTPGLLASAPARAAPRTAAVTYTVVHEFAGAGRGAYPASLMFKSDGVLYGITEAGGGPGRGTIFRIRGSRFEIAHAFVNGEAQRGELGGGKLAPLVEGPDGELYGTTFDGGNFQKGLAYRLNATDSAVQLHHFTGGEADGMSPNDQMVVGPDGAMYGTGVMVIGGWNQLPQAYRMAIDGTVTHLAQLGSWLNGLSRLTLASDGNFYSMSQHGGTFSRGGAHRTAPDGTVTPLYSVGFNRPDLSPSGGLVQHPNGLLYGTTENDPGDQQLGTVFRMTLDGKVKLLHRFTGPDGKAPHGLVVGSDGLLYGVARQGGPLGYGAVYRIAPDGSFEGLHAFDRLESPVGRLAEAPDGRLLGVTQFGPSLGFGSVYALRIDSLQAAAAARR